MRRLSILYSFPFRVGVSGIGYTAWSQVNALTELGVRVSLRCGSLERPLSGPGALAQTFRLGNRRLPIRPLGIRRAAMVHDRLTARALARGDLAVDAVHGWPLGSAETFRVAHRMGIPTFLERPNAHTGYAYGVVLAEYRKLGLEQPAEMTHSFDTARLAAELEEYVLADYLLCPSEFVASTFRANGFQSESLVSTQYGYDPAVFHAGPGTEGRAAGLDLLFAGSAEPRKGLHYALDAWLSSEAGARGQFLICGSFSEGYREFLQSRLDHPSVKVLGYTADMATAYQAADALVLPSVEEGSALVTYEAMACGATLLVSNSTGAHASHMREGLVHRTGNVDELRAHMDLIATDPMLLQVLRANALSASKSLTWLDSGAVLIDAYRARI